MPRNLNIARRHLDSAAKRALVEAELLDRTGVSNRTIAGDLRVSHPTVADVRNGMQLIGKIFQSDRVALKGGGTYPSARSPRITSIQFGDDA